MNADPSESYWATFASETKGGAVVVATAAGENGLVDREGGYILKCRVHMLYARCNKHCCLDRTISLFPTLPGSLMLIAISIPEL